MTLILLTILVCIVPSESWFVNSKNKVNNDHCEYSEVTLQPFKEITNSSLRSFLLDKLGAIGKTDCVQSYQVKISDSNPFYVFRIDRQTRFLRSFSVCGVITVNDGNFMWTACDNAKFRKYLVKCESEDGPKARHPQVPPVLSCVQTTTLAPRVSPPNEIAPPTPTPLLNLTHQEAPSTAAQRLHLTHQDASSTAAPRNITSLVVASTIPPRAVANQKPTTRKGWLKKLNCFSCV